MQGVEFMFLARCLVGMNNEKWRGDKLWTYLQHRMCEIFIPHWELQMYYAPNVTDLHSADRRFKGSNFGGGLFYLVLFWWKSCTILLRDSKVQYMPTVKKGLYFFPLHFYQICWQHCFSKGKFLYVLKNCLWRLKQVMIGSGSFHTGMAMHIGAHLAKVLVCLLYS